MGLQISVFLRRPPRVPAEAKRCSLRRHRPPRLADRQAGCAGWERVAWPAPEEQAPSPNEGPYGEVSNPQWFLWV